MNNNILSVIGNTPLVELAKLFENERQVQVFAKLEMLNPGRRHRSRFCGHRIQFRKYGNQLSLYLLLFGFTVHLRD